MGIFDIIFKKQIQQRAADAAGWIYPAGTLYGINFDGEQEPGAMPNDFVYDVDYYTMAERAYTLVTVNEYARLIVTRLTQFVVGTGLRLHPEPMKDFLKRVFNINLPEDFAKNIQELWNLFEDDKNLSRTKDDNLHMLAIKAYFNGLIAGDVLIIKRIVNNNLEYQLVNGLAVRSSKTMNDKTKNKIIDGVEIDANECPVAYYIYDKEGKEQRIAARDNKGRLLAWLIPVGIKRLNSPRAYSRLGVIMQKLHKIGQYTNSEIMAAEANSKFAATIEQEKDSTGVNPIKNIPGMPRGIKEYLNSAPADDENTGVIEKFKSALQRIPAGLFIHMPKGQKLNSFDTKRPNVNFSAFLDASMKYNTACEGIPFEAAVMQFSNNFSASRAALKMFEMILRFGRKYTMEDYFYKPIYEQFFELGCLKNNIIAPKFLELKNDYGYLDNAYLKAKFVGVQIPHIDEVKEVNAVLSKLKGGLTTFEQALESLGNTIDFDTLIERRKIEEKKIKAAGLSFETLFAPDNGGGNDEDTESDTKDIKRK
jgi:capsid protein